MQQQELLKRVVAVLDGAGIDYMVTGSYVSSMQGDPRSTHDIDIVVAMDARHVPALLAAFPAPEFYLDEHSVKEAVARRDMVNLLHAGSGDKVDLWLLTDEEFDQSRFARRIRETFDGTPIHVSSPEDTIVMKLRWADLSGGSQKQFIDALRVYETQFPLLDQAYLGRWAAKLGLGTALDELRKQANPI
jgi:hypothetical protein